MIFLGGALGGGLYSIKDRSIELPTRNEDNNTIKLGILADLFFGVSGGYVIFIILPSAPNPEETMGLIKTFSIAILGGYSGRILVEKEANQQLKEELDLLQEDMKRTSEQIEKSTGNALRLIYQILNSRETYNESEIQEVLSTAPSNVVAEGIGMVESTRKQTVLELLGLRSRDKKKEHFLRERLDSLAPLLSSLIKTEEQDPNSESAKHLHYHYSSLAYLYKDKSMPDWRQAYDYIIKAIESYSTVFKDHKTPTIYWFNALIMYIHLDECDNEKAGGYFDNVWEDMMEGRKMILDSNEIIAPKLKDWINDYKEDHIRDYIQNNETSSEINKYWAPMLQTGE